MKEMPSATADKWFYEEKGQRLGGIDESAMIALIQSGKLRHGSSVWKQGLADWMNLEDTPLRIHLDQLSPPPLTGQNVSNTLVWVLAFAPILGLFLESFVAMLVYDNENRAMNAVSDGKFFYITLVLNILLSVLDEKRLQKAGHNTSAFKGWVWLVPVYLYQRAKQLKQNLAYFSVWIACFVLVLLGMAA
ncbi:GYF domain 2 [compost metagenome]